MSIHTRSVRAAPQAKWSRVGHRLLMAVMIGVLLVCAIGLGRQPAANASTGDEAAPIPIFAYYYIWFDPTSWNRAKTDYPVLGRYSSSDPEVTRQHVRWAKEAGISGFIVSWKSTPVLNDRLAQLIDIAAAENFKLAIIYQGLDFEREPLPIDRIATDLDYFAFTWGDHPVFDVFEKPVVIWSGTWEFSEVEVQIVTDEVRDRLLILASERNLPGYERLARFVDGNAYYWSSVNPETYPGYQKKLDDMSAAVHEDHGLWIAPAAPGFDARLIGGTRVVERLDGETLRRQLSVALNSSPDMLGLISWNEFSENTHIEPSLEHSSRFLEVLADFKGADFTMIGEFDSSSPAATGASNGIPLLGLAAVLMAGSIAVVIWRETFRRDPDEILGHDLEENEGL